MTFIILSALECCLFSPSEEQEQLPTDARWYFGDRVKGEQLGCQIKEKVTADHSDVWVVNLYLNGEETSINEAILKKIEENKQVKSEGIMCRDIRLLEKKEDEADGIVSIRHTVNGSADAVKDDDVDAEPSNTSIEQCQSEEVDSMPMLASIESNSDDNTAIQNAATQDAENITPPSESAKEQELSQCASDLSEKAEDAEPPVSDLHVSNFDEEEVSPALPVDVAERPPISTVSDEPDVQESHMINIEEEEEKQLDIGESNSHNGAFVDKAFSQTDKMAATSENYPKLQNIQMVKDATFKLRVTSPLCVDGTFQVSLIYNQEIREEYDRFLEDMSSHAEQSQPVCDNVSMGQLVAVQYEDRWQRGMMKDHDVGQGYVQIQLVDDEGQVELINRETIRLLTDTYSLLAPQSVKCSISKEECPVFSHQARDTFKALVEGSELSAFVTKVVPNIQTYVQLYSGHVDITQQLYDAELSNVQENHTSPDSTNGVEVPHQQNNMMLYTEREPRPLLGAGQQNLHASAWLDAGAAPFIPAEQTGPHAPPGGHFPGPHLGPHPGPLHPGAHLTRLPFHLPPPNMNHNMQHNFPTLLEQGLRMQQLQLSAHDSRESGAPRFRSPPQIYRGDEGSAHRSPPQQNTERFPSDIRGGVVTQAREGNPAHGDQYQDMPDRCYTTPPANWHRDRNLHNTTRGQGDHQQDGGDGYDDSVWDEDNMPSFPFDLNSSPSSVTSDLGPRALMPGHPEHVPRSRDLESRDLSNFRCFGCHKLGHVQRNCPLKRSAGFHKYKSKGKRH
ncbi:uncharacterized protein LOC106164154 [Lingula anatina]|uniref:Uncharacterized protein LOC106164154 n=1 Tax=Lingula anatina TaxID=7574 RepID=A0A1S3IHR8_LINAN|nr:uncharacterized protein LOC106164154 [Lingula anatina]|eukprot:XP_013397416.1 uncharacterized protein LOC106164154 [Lingula anatina]